MIIRIIIFSVLVIAFIGLIDTWINTRIILKDLSVIKEKLRIQEEKKPSFLDKDLDND